MTQKYFKFLKKTKASVVHQCSCCGETISVREYYYREASDDRFLQSLHAKSFCIKCYEKFGDTLLIKKNRSVDKQNKEPKRLSDFV